MPDTEWTLSEAARLLGEPQHRLIHLCEKHVVLPDVADAAGRGSSRRFSGRNLLEFAIALRLRQLMMPVAVIGLVLYVLRAFETLVRQEIPGFRLPDGLRQPDSPELHILITGDQRLFFTLAGEAVERKVFGGLPLGDLPPPKRTVPKDVKKLLPQASSRGGDTDDQAARLELSVTRVAKELKL